MLQGFNCGHKTDGKSGKSWFGKGAFRFGSAGEINPREAKRYLEKRGGKGDGNSVQKKQRPGITA